MKTRARRWGNSLAVRIPKAFADDLEIDENALLELSIANGELRLAPVRRPELSLDSLLAEVTDDNLHQEIESGPPQGNEVW